MSATSNCWIPQDIVGDKIVYCVDPIVFEILKDDPSFTPCDVTIGDEQEGIGDS